MMAKPVGVSGLQSRNTVGRPLGGDLRIAIPQPVPGFPNPRRSCQKVSQATRHKIFQMANRYKVIHGGPYPHLITCSIVRWLPVFISGEFARIIVDSFRHLWEHRQLLTHGYVIMPTHIHAIQTARNDDLPDVMRDFKKFTSREIYRVAEASGNQLLTEEGTCG
jgi:REP element-mobilizing transposase RayT